MKRSPAEASGHGAYFLFSVQDATKVRPREALYDEMTQPTARLLSEIQDEDAERDRMHECPVRERN